MAYADFSLDSVVSRFSLDLDQARLFPNLSPLPPTAWLTETLARGTALALISEKARSEFVVAPILLNVRELVQNRIAIYSGQRLDVDQAEGLAGECDFLLAASAPLPVIRAPVVSVIEAKKADIDLGLGQCAAQMVGSLRFNEQAGNSIGVVYGCVTTGEVWQFLRLEARRLTIDTERFYIDDLGRILAAFVTAIAAAVPPA